MASRKRPQPLIEDFEDIGAILAYRLRSTRLKVGLTQEDLAKQSDLSTNYIGAVERNEANISVEKLAAIAEVLGIEPHKLLQPPPKRKK